MKPIYEYILNKDTKIKKLEEFPKNQIEQDIIDFLERQNFKKINIKEFYDTLDMYYRISHRLKEIEEKSENRQVYYLKENSHSQFNEIWFFKGGKISKDNPVFSVNVFPNKEKIHKGYYSSHIYYDVNCNNTNTECFSNNQFNYFRDLLSKYNISSYKE